MDILMISKKYLLAFIVLFAGCGFSHADSILQSARVDGSNNVYFPSGPVIGKIDPSSHLFIPANVVNKAGDTMTGLLNSANIASRIRAGVTQAWSGSTTLASMAFDVNAASATAQEVSAIFRMTSSTGAASGNGPSSAFKAAFGTEMTMNPGSGNGYANNNVLTINPGVGNFVAYGNEIDFNNNNQDYPFGGSALAIGQVITGFSGFPGTAAEYVDTGNTSTYMWHAAAYYRGQWLAKDYTIRDDTSSPTSYSVGPFTHSASTMNAADTSPFLVEADGHHDIVLDTTGDTTQFGVNMKDGQRICFSGGNACLYHSNGKLYYDISGVHIMSITDAGDAVFKGNVTGNGTP